jgi:hypothetical protein
MPNATVRANAQAMPIDRRLFLAAGAAATVLGALHAAAPPLDALIEAHRTAWRAFEDFCGLDDEHYLPSSENHPAMRAEWDRLSDLEFTALNALCAFRPTTMREIHLRGDYLADFLVGAELGEGQLDALLESFRSPGGRPGAAFRRDV